ncbi:MAG: hypothetical protein QOJ70_1132 [Acidobacteriota bacterium]|nr:hypothetical protein [Acidobacteriota bacterium]
MLFAFDYLARAYHARASLTQIYFDLPRHPSLRDLRQYAGKLGAMLARIIFPFADSLNLFFFHAAFFIPASAFSSAYLSTVTYKPGEISRA